MSTDGSDVNAEDASNPGRQRSGPIRIVVETLILVVVAIVLALIVKTFFAQAFYIPSISMEPGLKINDRIVVQKPSYWGDGSPQRGDIIVFKDPGGWLSADADTEEPGPVADALARIGLYPTGGHLVKRVIGTSGDKVRCCDKRGRLHVNGAPLDEQDFLIPGLECDGPMEQDEGTRAGGCRGWRTTVPDGHLFVMGDNRADSADSSFHLCSAERRREVGRRSPQCLNAFVPDDMVVGKVMALVWPLSHLRMIDRPDTFEDVPPPKH